MISYYGTIILKWGRVQKFWKLLYSLSELEVDVEGGAGFVATEAKMENGRCQAPHHNRHAKQAQQQHAIPIFDDFYGHCSDEGGRDEGVEHEAHPAREERVGVEGKGEQRV